MSATRFMTNDERESRAGGTQTSGIPSSRCMLARGPIRSNSRGTTSTITSRSRSDRTTSIVSVSGSLENATMTRSTRCSATSAWSSSSPPSVPTSRVSARLSSGSASTKPMRSRPYSGCWPILRATSWPISPAPTTTVRMA